VTSPTEPDNLLEVGRVIRPHGLKGEVVVHLTSNRVERMQSGAQFVGPNGLLTIRTVRPFAQHPGRALMHFDGVASREAAELIRDHVLFAPPIDDPDELFVHDLIGLRVIDQHGVDRGAVVGVQDNPAHDLLVLESGHLVPVVFMLPGEEATAEVGCVRVSTPEGLFDTD